MGIELGAVEGGQAVGGAERIESVAGAVEEGAAQGAKPGMQRVLHGIFEGGILAGFFPDDGFVGQAGCGDDFGKDIGDGGEVRSEAGGLHEQCVVAGVCGDCGTEGYDC